LALPYPSTPCAAIVLWSDFEVRIICAGCRVGKGALIARGAHRLGCGGHASLCPPYRIDRFRGIDPLSEYKEIAERVSLVQPADCLCEQWRRRQDRQLVARRISTEAERWNRVDNDESFDRRIGKNFDRAGHEQTMRDECDDPLCSGFASGASGT